MNTSYAARAAERRSLVFALPAHKNEFLRSMDAGKCRNILQEAACLAVRSGRGDVANDVLTLLARLEARQ